MHAGTLEGRSVGAAIAHFFLGAPDRELTTLEIADIFSTLAPSTDVAAARQMLRPSGRTIIARYVGRTPRGRKIYSYRLGMLTCKDGRTCNNTQWGKGTEYWASGKGDLCGAGWLHAYEHPLLAVLHNPIHGNFQPDTMRLWEAETEDENPLRDGYLKLGVRHLRTVREIPVPVVTAEQRVRYAILCAMEVYRGPMWMAWAEGWLSGRDRSEVAAWAAVTKVQEEAQATMRAEAAVRAAQAELGLPRLAERAMTEDKP